MCYYGRGFVRTPLVLMDSLQKAVVADAKRRKVTEYDPMGRVRSTFEQELEQDAMAFDLPNTNGIFLHHRGSGSFRSRLHDDVTHRDGLETRDDGRGLALVINQLVIDPTKRR